MNWKEFFKPNKKKLALSIIPSLVLSVLYYWLRELSSDPIGRSLFEWLKISITSLLSVKGILSLVIVFAIFYLIWSLIEKSKMNKRVGEKSSWKEFFKPTKWKIFMIFIIIFFSIVLFFITLYLNGGMEGDTMGVLGHILSFVLLLIIYPPLMLGSFIAKHFENVSFVLGYILISGTLLLYLYLLSCVIIFIHNKLKPKKKKQK